MCQRSRRRREVYQRIGDLCARGALGAPWQRLEIDNDCLRLPQDTGEMFVRLRECFSEQDLLTAGVARLGDGGELLLANALANPNAELVFLRERPYTPPFDDVTSHGLISGRELTIFAACRDHHTRAGLREWDGILLVAFSMCSHVFFRSMGLPVTLAAGLDDLSREQLLSLQNLVSDHALPHTGLGGPEPSSDGDAPDAERLPAHQRYAARSAEPVAGR